MRRAKQRKLLAFTLSWYSRVPPAPWKRHSEQLFVACPKQAKGVLPHVTFTQEGDYFGAQLETKA
jgi:hypothetical protein